MKPRDSLRSALVWWVDAAGRFALIVVVLALAAAAAALYYSAEHLGIYTDTNRMLSEELPFRRDYDQYLKDFPQYRDTLVVVVDGATPDLAQDAAEALGAHLAKRTDLFQTVYPPGNEPFFERHALLYLSLEELEDLADSLAQVQPFLGRLARDQSIRGLVSMLDAAIDAVRDGEHLDLAPLLARISAAVEATLAQRFYQLSWQELIQGRDADIEDQRRFVSLQPRLDYSKLQPAEQAIQAVRQATRDLGLTAEQGVRVRLTGDVALAHEELQTASRGVGIAGLASLVLVSIVLGLGLGAWRLVLATLTTLVVGLTLTAGFATAAVGHLNLISIAFAVLYIGLGVDYAIHLSLRYKEAVQSGLDQRTAVRQAAEGVGGALMLCAVTTAIGFYAFIPTAFAGVAELGLIAGTGIFISLAATLTLLPALLGLMPPTRFVAPPSPTGGLKALRRLPTRHARPVLWTTAAVVMTAVVLLPRVRFDFNPLNLRDPATESVATINDLIEQGTGSPWTIVVVADDLQQARAQAARLERLALVDEALTVEDLLPAQQADKLAIIQDLALIVGPELGQQQPQPQPPDPARQPMALQGLRGALDELIAAPGAAAALTKEASRLRDSLDRFLTAVTAREAAARGELLTRLEHSLLASLPARMDSLATALDAGPVSLENLPPEILRRWVSADGRYRIEVIPRQGLRTNQELRAFVRAVQAVAPRATEAAVINAEAGQTVVRAFLQAFGYALAAIISLLLVLLRNGRDLALVLTPLLLAAALTGAASVVLHVPFNFANVIALPLLLGIGIDSAIHMVHRARTTAAGGANLLVTSTARAVLLSALTTVCSFGTLALSPHPGTASMGLMLALGVGFTLISSLIVLPALLQLSLRGQDRGVG